jgi:hypothetical protein
MNIWTPERLHGIFRHYADVDFPGSGGFLYAAIADRLADDAEVLEMAATVRAGQPPPNLLYAAVHALLLSGVDHPLSSYYPDLTPTPLPKEDAYPPFRDFCMQHKDRVVEIVQSRLVQTNVLERCGLLLPAFAAAAGALGTDELAMVEIGASAGLNLLWDRYHYTYGDATWGDASSSVHLEIEVRGEEALPPPQPALRAVWRRGVDLNPVDLRDPDALLWQRALMWPERLDRQQRLEAARTMFATDPPMVVAGDAVDLLPALIAEAPPDTPLCVFASYTLYQFLPQAREWILEILERQSASRPIALITLDSRIGDAHGTVTLTLFKDGARKATSDIARGHPHGMWVEWIHEEHEGHLR